MSISVSEAGRRGGSVRSERKAAASRENAKLGGRPLTPIEEIECTCGRGAGLEGHKATCKRARAIKRRETAGKPLE
jgi:hypothetical protein